VVVTSNVRLFRAETENFTNQLATVLSEFAVAPLSFNDVGGAREVLAKLETTTEVELAAIYAESGELFAGYSRTGAAGFCPVTAPEHATGFANGYYETIGHVQFRGERLGTVLIRSSTAQLNRKITEYLVRITLIFMAVLCVCVLLALRLERVITGPISRLAAAADGVTRRADYSVRVRPEGSDEIGRLYEAFNQMLATVDKRQLERDEAEALLRASEAKYRAIVEDQTELICRCGPDGDLMFVNQAYSRFFDKPPEELIGTPFSATVVGDDRAHLDDKLSSLNAEHPVGHVELRLNAAGGDVRWLLWTIRAIVEADNRISVVQFVGRDISDLKRAEEEKSALARQLEHSQRLETIGTLAGGIAHDFNNILTPIIGCIELAKMDIPTDSEAWSQLQVALASSDRARELVQQILTFSRHAEQRREPVRLGEIVEQALKLLRASLPRTIELRTKIDGSPGLISATPAQIHQAVINLCTNAFQAMELSGGLLELSVDSAPLDDNTLPPGTDLSPGRYARLTVRDTGPGIPENAIDRIFEPFFTTKPTGQGTGLGLSVVHGIVTGHDGHISVESTEGRGTTFTILFPEAEGASENGDAASGKPETGSGRVLFVDDEPAVGTMAKRMLESLGYDVVCASSPAEALQVFGETAGGFDVVVTDQTMPGMTGYELAKRLSELDPGIRIVLTSGYRVGAPAEADMADYQIAFYLQKPFSMDEIGRALKVATSDKA
jgi:PAS domain S-box-containing protein